MKILKTINDDPEGFFENGGWNFLEPDSDTEDHDDDDEEDEDETFEISEDEGSEEDSDSEEYSEVDEDEDDDDDSASGTYTLQYWQLNTYLNFDFPNYPIKYVISLSEGGSSEESGKDWSDLEAEAAEADKNQNNFQDEYTRTKGSSGGSKRPVPSSSSASSSRHRDSPSKKHKRYLEHSKLHVILRLTSIHWLNSLFLKFVQFFTFQVSPQPQ